MRKLAFLAFMAFMVSASAAQSVQPKPSDQNRPILAQSSNPQVVVSLSVNRSTGYGWFLYEYDHNLVEPQSYQYTNPGKTRPGAPGVSTWIFQLKENAFRVPRVIKIKMLYGRPWEISKAKEKEIIIVTKP